MKFHKILLTAVLASTLAMPVAMAQEATGEKGFFKSMWQSLRGEQKQERLEMKQNHQEMREQFRGERAEHRGDMKEQRQERHEKMKERRSEHRENMQQHRADRKDMRMEHRGDMKEMRQEMHETRAQVMERRQKAAGKSAKERHKIYHGKERESMRTKRMEKRDRAIRAGRGGH